jgi:hypothetical protein
MAFIMALVEEIREIGAYLTTRQAMHGDSDLAAIESRRAHAMTQKIARLSTISIADANVLMTAIRESSFSTGSKLILTDAVETRLDTSSTNADTGALGQSLERHICNYFTTADWDIINDVDRNQRLEN